MDPHLVDAFQAEGADLIVMASHMPGLKDHFISSNAAWIASHGAFSAFIVR